MAERRQAGRASLAQRLLSKGEIALFRQLDQQRVISQMRLDDHLAGLFSSPCAAGYLDDQLRHAFTRTEVCREQPTIGIKNGDQGHSGEVMTLCKHLSAHQQAWLAAVDGGQQMLHRALAGRAVTIDAQHRVVRKERCEPLFRAFGARAYRSQVELGAVRAAVRGAFGMPAVVTAQFIVALMQGHSGVTARTLADPPAVVAQQGGGEAAPVEEHQYLLPGSQCLRHSLLQRAGNAGIEGAALNVQAKEAGRLCAAGALGQL